MMEGLLVILGATGNQGMSVIERVREQHPALKLRGLTRNPDSSASQLLKAKGVEMVAGDMSDEESLVAAFKGATAIFAMTDFWKPFFAHLSSGHPDPWVVSETEEVDKGKTIVQAAATTLSTLTHFIFSSLPDPVRVSGGRIRTLAHINGKAKISQYIENLSPDSEGRKLADVTISLWCGYFMENYIEFDINKPRKNADGAFVILNPANPSMPIPHLAARNDVGLFVSALLNHPPQSLKGKPVAAASTTLTYQEAAATFSKVCGYKVKYEQMPPGQLTRSMPGIGAVFEDMFNYLNDFGFCGNMETLNADDIKVKGNLTTFEDFVRQHDWARFFADPE